MYYSRPPYRYYQGVQGVQGFEVQGLLRPPYVLQDQPDFSLILSRKNGFIFPNMFKTPAKNEGSSTLKGVPPYFYLTLK